MCGGVRSIAARSAADVSPLLTAAVTLTGGIPYWLAYLTDMGLTTFGSTNSHNLVVQYPSPGTLPAVTTSFQLSNAASSRPDFNFFGLTCP